MFIFLGHDKTTLTFKNTLVHDEIQNHIDCRYISACEAFWRIFSFKIHSKHPAVQLLAVHAENLHQVYFNEDSNLEQVLQNEQRTHLTAFFENNRKERLKPLPLNQRQAPNGTIMPHGYELKYLQYPKYYTWDNKNKLWVRRKDRNKKKIKIGRMWWIPPATGETFYLRMLLNYIEGPSDFEDLKDGCSTYQQACIEKGILKSDKGNILYFFFTHKYIWLFKQKF